MADDLELDRLMAIFGGFGASRDDLPQALKPTATTDPTGPAALRSSKPRWRKSPMH